MRLYFRYLLIVILLFFGVGLSPALLESAQPTTVAIFPFRINAAQDLGYMQNGIFDMLSARLSWGDKVRIISQQRTRALFDDLTEPLNDGEARKLGARLEADYVLYGSLTVFGNSVSIDAKMLDVEGQEPPVTVFNQSEGMDEVIPKINVFAQEINEKVFGRAAPQPAPTGKPESPPRRAFPEKSIYAHPETVLEQPPAASGRQTSELNPDFIAGAGRRDTASFWKSRNFEVYIKAVALGDVDGDGVMESAFVSENELFVYRNEAGRFIQIREIPGESYFNYIGVDVADINDNGKAEIFVTNLNTRQDRLESFVLEWDGNEFATISNENNWYYRVLETTTRGTILLGQKRGINDLFLSPIHQLGWRGATYESVGTIRTPEEMNLFSFALGDVMNNGREEIVALNEDDYLQIFTKDGTREYKSDEQFGGSVNFMDFEPHVGQTETERFYFPQRIFIKDLDKDGQNEVIVVRNHAGSGRLFKRYRHYSSAEIASMSWDSMGLALNWKTRKIHGYVSDYVIGDFDNDRQPELVAAVVMKKGAAFLVKPKSTIISYDIASPSPSGTPSE